VRSCGDVRPGLACFSQQDQRMAISEITDLMSEATSNTEAYTGKIMNIVEKY